MGGRGPAPKPANRRARTNAEPMPSTYLEFREAEQPELPESVAWCEMTRTWWRMWGNAAQSETFTESDWLFLLDTALLHNQLWSEGDMKAAAEIRLRVAKVGATPEDRARLRMVFADADKKDAERPHGGAQSAARERRGPLRAV